MRTYASDWRSVNGELAGRITVTGVESLAVTRTTLHQLAFQALRAGNKGFIRFIYRFAIVAFRVVATADEHAVASLTQRFILATLRAGVPFEHLDDVAVSLIF